MERTFRHMEVIAARSPAGPVWLVLPDGSVRVLNLAELVAKDRQKKPLVNLTDCTVVLPPDAGGLGFGPGGVSTGMLDGDTAYQETHRALYDVADGWTNEKGDARRRRVWDDQARPPGSPGMRLVRTVDTDPEAEDDKEDSEESARRRYWHWYVRPRSADDDGSGTRRASQVGRMCWQ
jgi:CRISPR-associated endonuclease/helicase Cas3